MEKIVVSRKFLKNPSNNNPLLSNYFCADPFAIEHEGRLYVFGTNDNQQYECEGDFGKNTYDKIKSLVCFSTKDMVNWTFNGILDLEKIAPWVLASLAPSIIKRKEDDGLTHFYMYFSNTGYGVCVLTATNPLGPWTSPLNQSLIYAGMEHIEEVPNPFDPGACIDKNGNSYLVFGGGIASDGTEENPKTVRIVKLGKDMVSLEEPFVEINAPYFLEASSLYFINDYYIYAYNSNWVERKNWNYGSEKSTQCSLNYMAAKTPLDSKSWKYCGNFFKNPGDQGLNYSNNHGNFAKFKDKWFLFYHSLILQEESDCTGGFRSICADVIEINENSPDGIPQIKMCNGTRHGVEPVDFLNPFKKVSGSTIHSSAQIDFESEELSEFIGVVAKENGAWLCVKNVDFGNGAQTFCADFTGDEKSFLEVRLDKLSAGCSASICSGQSETGFSEPVSGVHTVFLIFSSKNSLLNFWYVK